MTAALLFQLTNFGVMPAWLLLAFFPRWRGTQLIAGSLLIPTVLAIGYLSLAIGFFGGGGGDFGSIEGVRAFFANDWLLLAGWMHYLCFDLFVGTWMLRDAQILGIRHAFIVPSLFFTLMLGPIGFLSYLALRFFMKKKVGF